MDKKSNLKKFIVSILQPGGNDTAIVKGFVPKSLRKVLNNKIIQQFPNVEQCGFYEVDSKKRIVNFSMMGGEFSGNAMLAVTFLVLNGRSKKLKIKPSGYNSLVETGIKDNIIFSEIPIFKSFKSVQRLDRLISLVKLKGISHLVVFEKINKSRIVAEAKKLLKRYNLFKYKCSGCIFVEDKKNAVLEINPVVWIRDVKTLTYETACGSGTVAVGLSILKNSKKNQIKLKIKQPSGNYITVKAKKNKNSFLRALIEGKVTTLTLNQILRLEV